MTVADMARLAGHAEEAGLDGAYLVEAWRTTPTCLAALALATERIRIGPYVMNAHSRSPLFAGMAAVDLDEIAGGRLALAVGSGNRITNEKYQGIPVVRPLEKMRDYLEILALVTRARAGDRIEYAGEMHSSSGWVSQVTPVRDRIPIHLAATSPRMEQIAASFADGVALGSLVSASFVADVRSRFVTSEQPDFEIRATAFVSVDDDPERAREATRRAVVNLYAGKPHPHYDALLRRQGFEETADLVSLHVEAGDLDKAAASVDDEVVDALSISGTAQDCKRRLAEYSGAADELILMNVGAMRFEAAPEARPDADSMLASYDALLALAS